MPTIRLTTAMPAAPQRVFAACLDVGLHEASTGRSAERAVAGTTSGVLEPGGTVTWRARHLGRTWTMTVQLTWCEPPHRFVDEQVDGPFRRWRHEHVLAPDPADPAVTVMHDLVEFAAPAGPAGALVAVAVLRPYLRRLLARRNAFLARHVAHPADGDGGGTHRRPPVVVLCGSTRFRDAFAEVNRAETLAGRIVLAPGVFAHAGDTVTAEQKAALDALHLAKIDLADEVVVVAPGGYVGESTRAEVAYAARAGKPVRWYPAPPGDR